MFDRLRAGMLQWLKVPPEPHPPYGDPASLRVFRAGRNHYRLKMAGWGLTQLFALAGIVFWTGMLIEVERLAKAEEAAERQAAIAAAPAPATGNATIEPAASRARFDARIKKFQASVQPVRDFNSLKRLWVQLARLVPEWVFPLAWTLKVFGFVAFFVQLLVTYAIRRIDFEMRWYMVTDRSLRLRHGVWTVWESTMSFANVQQVEVTQGPLQRLLGLADVKVQSAGGGNAGQKGQHQPGHDMHTGYFHSVTNAEEIRDLILRRLRRFREAGLGDPDERPAMTLGGREATPGSSTVVGPSGLAVAARDLANEARALRATLAR